MGNSGFFTTKWSELFHLEVELAAPTYNLFSGALSPKRSGFGIHFRSTYTIGGGFKYFFNFHLGIWSNLTTAHSFQLGWNHQHPNMTCTTSFANRKCIEPTHSPVKFSCQLCFLTGVYGNLFRYLCRKCLVSKEITEIQSCFGLHHLQGPQGPFLVERRKKFIQQKMDCQGSQQGNLKGREMD